MVKTQGTQTLNEYYLEKMSLWQELDMNTEEEWKCSEDAIRFHKRVEKECLFEILAGPTIELDDVRGRILSLDPLPSVREAFATVRREDSRRRIMLKDNSTPCSNSSEASALAARSGDQKNKGKIVCAHCKKTGHTKDTCWDVHGEPPDWKPKKGKGRGYVAKTE